MNVIFDDMPGIPSSSDLTRDAGPLEAVIANLQREIDSAVEESRVVQRRWLGKQTELVALQGSCAATAEQLQRLRSEFVVWQQRHLRLSRL